MLLEYSVRCAARAAVTESSCVSLLDEIGILFDIKEALADLVCAIFNIKQPEPLAMLLGRTASAVKIRFQSIERRAVASMHMAA